MGEWIEKEKLAQMFAGSEEVLQRILGIFVSEAPTRLDNVAAGIEAGDIEQAAVNLHSLKNSSSVVLASGLVEQCREMEEMAREGRLEDVARAAGDLEERTRGAVDEARDLLESLNRGQGPSQA